MWISPAFMLQVIRAYDVMMNNHVPEHVARAYDELTQNKIPIHRPLTAQEFKERYRFHENALESLEEASLTLSGKEFLALWKNQL